jgi:TetR/AcrR family transcriptional regulator, mexJK operon transcriptional repressor
MPVDSSRLQAVDAARRVCAGGRQPTMDEIAAAAGVAVRTLYRLFGSRLALLREAGCAPAPTPRDAVLEAALELVGRRGLAELSMDDLAAAAGVSRATLYRLFPGKSPLFAELIRTYSPWEAVADIVQAMPDGRPEEVMPAVGRAIREALRDRAGLLLRVVFELARADPDVVEAAQGSMTRGLPDVMRYLGRQMEAGRLRRVHPVVALQLLGGPIVAHALTGSLAPPLPGFGPPPDDVVDQVVEAWLRAMAPDDDRCPAE